MHNVSWKNDCKVEAAENGYTLYSRWVGRDRAAPAKFAGAVKEWIVEFPNGDSEWAHNRAMAVAKVPRGTFDSYRR